MKNFTVEYWKERWQEVTKEDVEEMAQQIQHRSIYFLCGKEDENNGNN